MLFRDNDYVDLRSRQWVVESHYEIILPDFSHLNLSRKNIFTIPVTLFHV